MWRKLFRVLAVVSLPLRIIAPLAIFQFPLFVTVLVFFLDWIDGMFYYQLDITKIEYNLIDKSLDLYWYTISLIYGVLNLPYRTLLIGLYALRLVGHLIYYKIKDDGIFVYFPNIYENVFIFLLLVKFSPALEEHLSGLGFLKVFFILSLAKIAQEIYVHKWGASKINRKIPEWMRGPDKESSF